MKQLLSVIISAAIALNTTCIPLCFAENVDYEKLYLDFAAEADYEYENPSGSFQYHPLNDAVKGMIILDLNGDLIPELLTFSQSSIGTDLNGNRLYVGDEGYENPPRKEYDHRLERAFSIVDGEIKEDTPWRTKTSSTSVPMKVLPGEKNDDPSIYTKMIIGEDNKNEFVACYYPSSDIYRYSTVWYDDNGFGFSFGDAGTISNSDVAYGDSTVFAIKYYNDETKVRITKTEAMESLLDDFKNAVNNQSKTPQNKTKISPWAEAEIAEAKEKQLIPQEMVNDDLTESATRAEFAAIAYQLYREIWGEEINWHGGYIVDIFDNIYEMYIRGAYNLGMINGTGEKDGGVVFAPDLNITREQAATILCRAIKAISDENYSIDKDAQYHLDLSNAPYFNDHIQISDYAKDSVRFMNMHGIIKGIDASSFAPKSAVTKEQAISMALRIFNSSDKWENMTY